MYMMFFYTVVFGLFILRKCEDQTRTSMATVTLVVTVASLMYYKYILGFRISQVDFPIYDVNFLSKILCKMPTLAFFFVHFYTM